MVKNTGMLLKTFFIRLLFFSFFTVTVVHAMAQNSDPLPASFSILPEERIFIHTDRNLYFAGEIIWFKIYYVNASNLIPVTWSKIAYVELINKDSKAVWQSRISLKKDERSGSFHIPLSVATGNYTLRAYTNWMKNDADYFFQKQISIINTLRNQDILNPERSSAEYHIDFFPESGKLVNGVKTRIGFKLLNRFGKAINGKGFIVDGKNDTLVSFSTFRFGMGHFSLTPFSDERYKAVVLLDDGTITYKDLPHIFDHGYVMNITSAGNTIDVDLKSNISATIENEPVYFIAKAKDGQLTAKEFFLHNGNLHFNLPKISLGKGIIRCTFFDADKNPLCERLFFNIPDNKQLLTIEADKKEYNSRNKVQLSLKAAMADSLE
ncbi:MAG TPA: hypothetical protein VGO09_00415, partial [Flavisolibacter sp.]|nr:hypothetical protein [Flavisolibacter sp.]